MVRKNQQVLFPSKPPNSMPRKSNRDDLAASKPPTTQPAALDPGRQPRIVGWLVLIVGAFSSWYWYRPLPDSVNQTVHSTAGSSWPTSASGPKSLWTDQGLVVPSTSGATDNLPEIRDQHVNQPSDESRLIGAPKVTLIPWNDVQHDIRDILKTERVPMIPVAPDLSQNKSSFNSPQVWTPDPLQVDRTGETTHSNSSWPDQGYVPPAKTKRDQRRAAVQITTQIPPLLETGMKSIRTAESEESIGTSERLKPSSSEALQTTPSEPPRQPKFIRQPKTIGQSLRD